MTTAQRRARLQVGAGAVLAALAVAAALIIGLNRGSGAQGGAGADSAAGALFDKPAVVRGFLGAATSDIDAVTSYDYRSLDSALSNGLAVTTGEYRGAFRAALSGASAATARANRTVQNFDLQRIGIGTVAADGSTAKVLVFGVESVTDRSSASTPRTSPVALTATMTHRGDTYLISTLEQGTNAGLPPGTPELAVAAETGRAETVNVLSYRHDHFDADYSRAQDGAVDPLRTQLRTDEAATRAAVTRGGYDLVGAVTSVAVERASGDTAVLLMAATGSRVGADGRSTLLTAGRYEVTVVRVSGIWVTSDIAPLASS